MLSGAALGPLLPLLGDKENEAARGERKEFAAGEEKGHEHLKNLAPGTLRAVRGIA
jgi:hypothetical protein